MNKILIAITILSGIVLFFSYSWGCATKDRYLQWGDTEGVFVWEREFWNPASAGYHSISCAEVPFALIRYWTSGRAKMKQWDEYFEKNIAGRPVNEVAPLVEAEIKRRINQ